MKTINKIVFSVAVIIIIMINCFNYSYSPQVVGERTFYADTIKNKKSEPKMISRQELLKMNSKLESKGQWNVANRYGYMGKYQIGKLALLDLGYDSLWISELQNSIYSISDTIINRRNDTIVRNFYYFDISLFPPQKQEEVIRKLLHKNENVYLKKHIDEYVGKEIDGVRITKAGILSASFLGFAYVDKFLKSNGRVNPKDGNGHSIKDRMSIFENFEVI
jgi:hypothetical protein